MDTSNPVLHGLLRKRQEIADKLEVAQAQVRQLVLDIDAMDSTIRLFHPDVEIGVVRIKPAARGGAPRVHPPDLHGAAGGAQPDDDARDRAGGDRGRGKNTADHAMTQTMVGRMASTLRKLKNRGKLVADKQDGKNQRWGLART